MNRQQLIKKYLDFFKSKNHKIIENSSLIPREDPTVLFTTAGMHPLVPFLSGQQHLDGKRLCNVQRCLRTNDIDEVGDAVHHTFFEMLGNWSLGDYWKKQALEYTFEFVTKVLKLPIEKLAATCFKGDESSPKDKESAEIWKKLGIKNIIFLGKEDNWWWPAGKIGPCGPDTELFFWNSDSEIPKKINPKDERWVEIGNNVLMQYFKNEKSLIPANQKNIDFGGGVERMLAVLQGYEDNYLTDVWKPVIKKIEELSGKKYYNSSYNPKMRIIADHIKASVFILAEKITPSNTEKGYVLRRLIRRAVKYANELDLKNFTHKLVKPILEIYPDYNLEKDKNFVETELKKEEEKFLKTLEAGLKKFRKITKNKKNLNGQDAFLLYQSFGFPLEMIIEECKKFNIKFNPQTFHKENSKHQILSRTASAGKFKSGLADSSEQTTKLHTATHLLLASLKKVLKSKNLQQKGSNITKERLRLDFNFPRKLTEEEIKKVEDLVNGQIKKSLDVDKKIMKLNEAKKIKAEGIFDKKYSDKVSVFSIGDFSKEICTGPHVRNTRELGRFKILKEQSSSAGVRRIKAVLE